MLTTDIYKSELEYVRQEQDLAPPDLYAQAPESEDFPEEEEGRSYQQRKGGAKSRTPVLDNFGP